MQPHIAADLQHGLEIALATSVYILLRVAWTKNNESCHIIAVEVIVRTEAAILIVVGVECQVCPATQPITSSRMELARPVSLVRAAKLRIR